MSSVNDDLNVSTSDATPPKIMRVRACDICRRKKVRCDGTEKPDNQCTNCLNNKYQCTYIEAYKKRIFSKEYVEELRTKVRNMEGHLRRLRPDIDWKHELDVDRISESSRVSSSASLSSLPTIPPPLPYSDVDSLEPSDDETTTQEPLAVGLQQMQINPVHVSFLGKSSNATFLQAAIEAKYEYTGVELPKKQCGAPHPVLPCKRPQFWEVDPWDMSRSEFDRPFDFPERDLMSSLIDLYFIHINSYLPLLHRQTIETNVRAGLHLSDEGFGSIVLLICAVGSRFSDDPRVLLDNCDSTHSSGWAWFRQVQIVRTSLFGPPKLYDIQFCCLSSIFLLGTSAPQACWTINSIGLRLAVDVGAHRRKVYNSVRTVEEELWRRAFWILVYMDREMALSFGRPCTIQEEDFDLDPPVECDDEYWVVSDTQCQFEQPPDKPSKIAYFNSLLRLEQILAFALRTIYSINKSKVLLGLVGSQWEQRIVAEIDSALNKWIDSVPDHLRWDPDIEDDLFLNQSAYLYAHYYQLQIAVHRPFIPSPRKASPLSFPSLAICTNAARSCIHILDVPFRRSSTILFSNIIALFTSGIVLLLNIWGGKRSGFSTDPAKEMADVHRCMSMIKALEPRWITAGVLWDILYELACVGDLPLPLPSPGMKRRRSDRDPGNSNSGNIPANVASDVIGTRSISLDAASIQQEQHSTQPLMENLAGPSRHAYNPDRALPMYTEELGRLPLHPGYNAAFSPSDWSLPAQQSSNPSSSYAVSGVANATTNVDSELDGFLANMFSMSPSVYDHTITDQPISLSLDVQNMAIEPQVTEMLGDVDNVLSTLPEGDTLAMWSNAPQSFEWNDWESYITNFSGAGTGSTAPNITRSQDS